MKKLGESGSSMDPRIELQEANAFADFFRAAPEEIRQRRGIDQFDLDDARGVLTSAFDILAFNRVVGLGIGRPATPTDIELVIDRFSRASVPRFFVQVAPQAQPAELSSWLAERGFVHYNNWAKLCRGIEDPPEIETDLRVKTIGADHANVYGEILVAAFEWPTDLAPVIAALVGRPGWVHYLAFAGDLPAATAAMYVQGEWCWIDFASTVAKFRGRRAQPALISRRIRDAADMGCRHLIVETAEDLPEKPGISCRNVQKMGFEIAYLRSNWLYTF